MSAPPPGEPVVGNDWATPLPRLRERAPSPVSVVVLHYEQHEQLARTLHALERQTHPRELIEVVVVDDGSREAPQVPDGVRLVRRADVGFTASAARNEGAAATSHPTLLFLDADTTPEPGYVAELALLPAHLPEVVAVGRRRHADLAGTPVDAPVEMLGPPRELAEPQWLAQGFTWTRDLLEARSDSYRYVISAVLACSRWLFDEVGGFDESFDSYGGEDWEWAWRAWQHGAALAHRPGAVAWHDGPERAARDAADVRLRETQTRETLRLAGRVADPTVAFSGLALSPPELLVTLDPDLGAAEALIGVDSVLAAVPTARVSADPDDPVQRLLVGDPRVAVAAPLAGHALRLHLRAGVRAAPEAWQGLLALARADGHPHTVTVVDDAGELLALEALRAHRRMTRWGRDDLFEAAVVRADDLGLRRVPPDADLAAHLGGWL
ncbi:glycosyltransferase [Nocardioides flavescens]|uniref:glycosyltransferase n=1 Tax=Nocardioides flavescens TaxID=2691959 RepID=UPI00136A7897